MVIKKVVSILGITMALVSCADLNNQGVGTLTGGAIGGLLGSRFGGGAGKVAAAAGGALIGAYLGGRVGQTMDKLDAMKFQNSLETTATGNRAIWTNPDSGNAYAVTPTKTYYHNNRPCRQYKMQATIEGSPEVMTGTACRQADGSWKAMK